MKTLSLPGTWCGDCTPLGSWAALYPEDRPDPHIQTSRGRIELPGMNVLTLVCAEIGAELCVAGQGQRDDFAQLWNGHRWIALEKTYGSSPCAFGPYGLYVSCPGTVDNVRVYDPLTGAHTGSYTKPIGGRGIAAVDGLGVEGVHSQDAWYGKFGLGEYVEINTAVPGVALIHIGQGIVHDGLKVADHGMLIQQGLCQFNRVHFSGDQFATASWLSAEGRTVFLWPTLAELATIPPETTIPPVEPPVSTLPDPAAVKAALQHERDKYPATVTETQMGAILNDAAFKFADTGMHRKAGQATQPVTGIPISHDVLRYMPADDPLGWWADVLGATGAGVASPQAPDWQRSSDGRESFVIAVNSGGGPVDPPTGNTHRYVGGAHDSGVCDQCGQVRVSDVHRVPEGKVPHTPYLGEDGIGDCDLCFQAVSAPIHTTGPVPPTGDLDQRVTSLEAEMREVKDLLEGVAQAWGN